MIELGSAWSLGLGMECVLSNGQISSDAYPSGPTGPETGVVAIPDLRVLARSVLRRWKLILGVPLTLLAVAQVVLYFIHPVYRSDVQVLVFDPHQPRIDFAGEAAPSASDFDQVAINTEMEVLKSASLLLQIATDLRLDQDAEFQHHNRLSALLRRIGVTLPGANTPSMSPQLTAASLLRSHISIDRVPLSYVLVISATARTPQRAQQIANAIISDYLAGQNAARRRSLDQAAGWLDSKLAEVKTRLARTESELLTVKAGSGAVSANADSVTGDSQAGAQLADLTAQLVTARTDLAERQARLDDIQQVQSSVGGLANLPASEQSPLMSQMLLEESALTERLGEMQTMLGAHHADVTALQVRLAGVRSAMAAEATRIANDAESEYAIAKAHERDIAARVQRLTAVGGTSDNDVKAQQLEQFAEADARLYDTYMAQYQEIIARQAQDNSNERVISAANLPTAPVFPRRMMVDLGAVGGGGFLAFGAALGLALIPGGTKPAAEAERIFGLPVLGNVPLVGGMRRRGGRSAGQDMLPASHTDTPNLPVYEAIQAVRVGLGLASAHPGSKIVMVTSSVPDEGKTTLARLLAVSAATAGQRIALLDCDLRRATLSRHYGLIQQGLADVLTGSATLDAVTFRDRQTGMDVIPAGQSPRSPVDLWSLPNCLALIQALRAKYDLILMDTPPVLAAADVMVLAPFADRIALVVDGSFSHDASIMEALRVLRPQQARLAGIIYNKVAADNMALSGYDYGYLVSAHAEQR